MIRLDASQDVSPEIDAAAFKSDLFTKAFARSAVFEAVRRETYGPTYDENEAGADQLKAASLRAT